MHKSFVVGKRFYIDFLLLPYTGLALSKEKAKTGQL